MKAPNVLFAVGLTLMMPISAQATGVPVPDMQNSTPPSALQNLTINGQPVTTNSVRRVDMEGPIYEVRLRNGDTFYSDAQGRHMVVGSLYDNSPDGLINVTEEHDRQDRLDQLNAIPEGGTVDYPAQGEEIGRVTVFTDTTCPYCQKLHQEINQLTQAGIAVRYVPFPRAGTHSLAANHLAQVLCSQLPTEAMTRAFRGDPLQVTPVDSCRSAVEDGFALGEQFGVQGTPSIVLPNGEMGEGYVPAQQLIQAIGRSSS
ncbi:DsbC family protein [Salinicola rhizosphaerae]|uniref:Thiol:disulfide interchange protein n=1 Tax=Salinicola rhizosphaerae TaxID=1443141 RepID=A0ABQ3E4U9_9GAMM|nr:DsbC family protein [Salinicola rhizosphaerae]GHB26569.1 thiol:disulfide interchange protein DsbC [Salinicola rhizosphaerae]